MLTSSVTNASSIDEIYKEAESLKKLKNKNIIELYHAFAEQKVFCMIMECAPDGELLAYVEERTRLDEHTARIIFKQICSAISYCHSRGIVHRDLKMENVLFKDKEHLHIKVVDFGIAGVCKANKQDKVEAGSLAYMPPEVLAESNADTTTAIDVWAIGCIFYGMIYGKLPFWGDTEDEFARAILKQKPLFDVSIPFSKEGKTLLTRMLDKDP